MKMCSIRSGSRGNAILIWTDTTKIMVDCGISGRAAEEGLLQIGLDPKDIAAIVITHEHTDHIKGAGIMARRHGFSIYANQKTWTAMEADIGSVNEKNQKVFDIAKPFGIGDIEIKSFSVSHDAAEPVGYTFQSGNKKMAVATDMGILEEGLFRAIKGSKAVLLEANHDINMLEIGNYPYYLKQRIRGDRGHLSNDDAGKAAEFLVKLGTEKIMLGHLSPENNYPQLAERTVYNALISAGITPGEDMQLSVAPGTEISKVIEV